MDHSKGRLPRHIAIIMDGNGRWGLRHGKSRIEGHRQAVNAIERVVDRVLELGIPYLTLYCFSEDNLNRPLDEVSQLFSLFEEVLSTKVDKLREQGVRLVVSGKLYSLAPELAELFRSAEEATKEGNRLTLVLAVMYSGREEIVEAARRLATRCMLGEIEPEEINRELFARHLYHPEIPDPDLLIRSSGEKRLSDFLLWQLAYTELIFTDTLWPDFDRKEIDAAIEEYRARERRFGRVVAESK